MDLLWQIDYGEMFSGLGATTFIILLAASMVVVCLMVMLPLIDLAFERKAKPALRPVRVETGQLDSLTDAQLSGRPWLALRSDFSRADSAGLCSLPLVRMAHYADAHPPLERITPLKVRSLAPKGASEGAVRPS
jgi:hypothetical protein